MERSTTQGQSQGKKSVDFTRHYPVAPEKVWRAWTDPQALAQWFGPEEGSKVTIADMDVRVGGRYHIRFGVPGQETHDVEGTYLEVELHRKLVFDWGWKSTPERISLVTITLKPSGSGTELVFKHEKFYDQAARDSHNEGWAGAFVKLDKLLMA
jgi:uncharacterized protein YndB with AHSA1/START domain